jgi:hypothetical protein
MNKDTVIITAPLSHIEGLLSKGYVCVSVIGKVYKDYARIEEVERITNLNVFRLHYHIKSKDYYACQYLYCDILQKKGIKKLLQEIDKILVKHNKTKIALCDDSTSSEFGFRHILRCFLIENDIKVSDIENINLEAQKEYWQQDSYKAQGHYNLTNEFVCQTLENSAWIYARTMPKNPHWYTLRKDFGNNEVYKNLVSHIRFYGKPEIFEGVLYRVFYYKAYKYWDHPCDELNEDVDLINRCQA